MAADDQKLETLEEEIKVLKGEVRRTLVDLRALVMREDSPLSESAYGRRAALADMASGDELPAARRETAETIRQEAAGQPAAAPAPPPPAFQQDAARAEQESRFADQERRMAAQERKFEEQERRLAEASRPDRGEYQRNDGKDAEQERKIAEQERKIAEQERKLAEASRTDPGEYQRTGGKDPEQERKIAEQERKIAEQEQRLAEASRSERDKDERTVGKDAELERKVAEQERKIAEQEQNLAEASRSERDKDERTHGKDAELEQKVAEQERKIAEQEQRLAEASRAERDEKEQTDTKDVERERMSAEKERRPAEASRSGPDRYDQGIGDEETAGREQHERAGGDQGEGRGAHRDNYNRAEGDDGVTNWSDRDYYGLGEEGEEEQEAPRTTPRPPISDRGNLNPKGNEHRAAGQPERAPIVEHDHLRMIEDEDRKERRPRRQRLPQITPHNGSRTEHLPDREEEKQYPRDHKERGSPVFDEYFELMKESEEAPTRKPDAALPPLDLNLVASLVRWASIAKQRVGEQRLSYVLDLYFQSGHSSPGLQALLSHVVEIADEAPPDTDQIALVCVDLIAHLHGILTGGLPIVTIPEIKVPG